MKKYIDKKELIISIVFIIFSLALYSGITIYLYKNLSQSIMRKSLNIPSTGITKIITEEEVYKQSFKGNKNIIGISLHFATNMSQIQGKYLFTIYDNNNKFIYSYDIDGKTIEDNQYYDINLEKIFLKNNKNYYFSIRALEYVKGDKLVLWTGEGNYYLEGVLYENLNELNNDITFEFITNGPNRFLIVIIPITIFFIIVMAIIFSNKVSISAKKLIVLIYICSFIFAGFKMMFYLNYSRVDRFDELAHISYIAYLKENNHVIIPKFSDIKILMQYTSYEKDDPYSNVTATGVYSGYYHGKFTKAINYLGHPPLYYHIMNLTNSVHINGDEIIINLIRLRVFNIIIVLVSILIMFYVGYTRISKRPYLHLLFALIVNSVHMLLYEGASVNNDNFTLMGVTIFILGAIRYSEKKYNLKTYLLVSIGILLTVLSKLSAASIIVVAALILVIRNCINERSVKSIFNKKFFITLPIYLFGIFYYIYIFFSEGTVQPSLSTYGGIQFTNNTLVYVQPELRIQLSFMEFFKSFWFGFFSQWTAGVPGFIFKKSIFTFTRFGTMLFWIIPLLLFTKFIRKNGDNKIKVYFSIIIGTIVALALQLKRAIEDFYFISGHFSCQSRYYVCLPLGFALIIIFILETCINKSQLNINIKDHNGNILINRETIAMTICILYSSLLLFEGFIQCIIENMNYLL